MALAMHVEHAHAQGVIRCDVAGRPVFQSSPCALEARAAAVAPPPTRAETGTPRKKTLAELLRERDAADPPRRAPVREAERDGAEVLRARMGAV